MRYTEIAETLSERLPILMQLPYPSKSKKGKLTYRSIGIILMSVVSEGGS